MKEGRLGDSHNPRHDVSEFLVWGCLSRPNREMTSASFWWRVGGGLGTRNALSVLALIDRNLSRDAHAPEGFRV